MKCCVIGNGSSLYPEILDRRGLEPKNCPVKLDYGKKEEIHRIAA